VGHTFFLLTATVLAGQAPGTDVIKVPESPRTATLGDPVPGEHPMWDRMRSWSPFSRNNNEAVESNERPRLFQRMQTRWNGLFQHHPSSDNSTVMPALTPQSSGATSPGISAKHTEPPLAEPKSDSNLFVAPINFHAAPSSAAPKALSSSMAEKAGHDTDYTWITGQIRKENGSWVIHYSNPEVVDRYNGRLTLTAPAERMSSFRDGDLVSVQGQVAGSAYHATAVNLVEHDAK